MRRLLLIPAALAAFLPGLARADSDVPSLAAATSLSSATAYLANAGATNNSVGFTTSVFDIVAGALTLKAGGVSDAMLASTFLKINPALGTPVSGVGTNLTGTAAGLTAGHVTTNANLTGPVTSVGNATAIANGTITNAMLAGSIAYTKLIGTDIVTVGTLAAGATGAGFTINLGASTVSGALPAANMPAHTGDVTSSAGSVALTIAANAVTNAKAAQMANGTVKCRTTAGTGNAEDCTGAQATALLGAASTSTAGIAKLHNVPVSAGWVATVNPNNIVIGVINQTSTISAIIGAVEVATGGTATVTVYKAASGTACGSGTALHSGTFNANGTAATNQTLTVTTSSVSAGDRLCLQTTGTTTWTGGTGIGTITVFLAPS